MITANSMENAKFDLGNDLMSTEEVPFVSSQVEVMTLLKQEKSSEKLSLEKQIDDAQQSLNKREKELVAIQGELQQVYSDWIQHLCIHVKLIFFLMSLQLGFIEGHEQGKLNICKHNITQLLSMSQLSFILKSTSRLPSLPRCTNLLLDCSKY